MLKFQLRKLEFAEEIRVRLHLKDGVTEGTLSEISIRACYEGKYINKLSNVALS